MTQSIIRHLERESLHGGYEAAEMVGEDVQRAYASVARLIGARPRNVALVENATVAVAQVLSAFAWTSQDRILTTRADYASNQLMFLRLRDRFGVAIDHAPDEASGGIDVDAADRMLRSQPYALVVATWIPTNSGLVQDVASLGAACARRGVPFLIDACQAVGQIPVDVAGLSCDFLAATGRKFLRGPRGIGFLYVSDAALDRGSAPLFTDLRGATWVAPVEARFVPDARRFENWEFSYALVLGLGAAADYALEAGIARTSERALGLAEHLRGLLASDRWAVLDRGKTRGAIVSAALEGKDPFVLVSSLRRKHINVWAIPREHAVFDMDEKNVSGVLRVSPHYYNTESEIDALVAAIRLES